MLVIRNDLVRAGIAPNKNKSIWSPCQSFKWLGIILDLSSDNSFDLKRTKATDVPFNKRVHMPQPHSQETESKIRYAKEKIRHIITNYSANHKGFENIDKEIKTGIKELKKRIKEDKIVVYPTDKSGRLSVDTQDNYKESMKEHLVNMSETNITEYRQIESKMNALSGIWCTIMQANNRAGKNFISKNNDVPPLYGLRKDHKPTNNPPLRPICGAVKSCNVRLSYLMSEFLTPIVESAKTTCDSTEDLLAKIKQCNDHQDLSNCYVGSMDVKALYPSIDVEFATEKAGEFLMESNVKFENINTEELGLFLSLIELETKRPLPCDVKEFCPKRKHNRRGPTITGSGCNTKEAIRWAPWVKPIKTPGLQQVKRMMITAIKYTILEVLKNHVCKFSDKLYKQQQGGAIGVSLAGRLANTFMIWWDRQFIDKLQQQKIDLKLYSRYVDDIICVLGGRPVKTLECKEVWSQIQQVANSIHQSIKVTVDYPKNNDDARMPVLDLKVWFEKTDKDKVKLMHTYYMKPMANKGLIHRDSALSMRTKIQILIADLVRIMRNISPLITQLERKKHIQHFIDRLQYSGYSIKERKEIYFKAKQKYDKMVTEDNNAVVPLYRHREWERERRDKEKREKRKKWYRKGGYESVMFVDATPESKLKRDIQNVWNETGLKIKVIEKSGISIKKQLCSSDPFPRSECCDKDCKICPNKRVNCKDREVVYAILCSECKDKRGMYIGETARSVGERFKEHIENYESKNERSALYKHSMEHHNGRKVKYDLKVITKCLKDPMKRQIGESEYIKHFKPELNSKDEWCNSQTIRARQQLLSVLE